MRVNVRLLSFSSRSRLQFPKQLHYILYHKYPQRLDYIFFQPGGLGELFPIIDRTRIEKFLGT